MIGRFEFIIAPLNHNGVALTNVNFENLSNTMGLRGRQDHYHAYVEDFTISQMANGSKVMEFKENPTKQDKEVLGMRLAVLPSRCVQQTVVNGIP